MGKKEREKAGAFFPFLVVPPAPFLFPREREREKRKRRERPLFFQKVLGSSGKRARRTESEKTRR